MRRFISGFAYVAVGVGLGGLSAYFSIEQSGAEQVADGSAWFKRDLSPGSEDGYLVRAHFMLGGRLPPPPGQLTELSADTDDEGRPLRTQCVYRLAGRDRCRAGGASASPMLAQWQRAGSAHSTVIS